MTRKYSALFLLTIFFSPQAIATPVVFDLRDSLIETIDEQQNFTISKDGIVATFTSNTGVLNGTSSGFGVNATGSGDATSLLDDGSGIIELIQIQFNKAVEILNLSVSSFGSGDLGLLSVNNAPTFEIRSSGLNILNDIFIDDGSFFSLSFISGNGFSFDSFTVTETTVAEPSGIMLFLLSGIIFLIIQKYRMPEDYT